MTVAEKEPTHPRAWVRDHDGVVWVRHASGWKHLHAGEGQRRKSGWLRWAALVAEHGPLTVDEPVPEPTKRGSRVADRDGDVWERGTTRWTCLTPVDGVRVLRVGRLPWHALETENGPLTPLS